MSKIKSILSIIFLTIYGPMRIQLTHFSYDDCQNACNLSYYYHHVRIQLTHFSYDGHDCVNMCNLSYYYRHQIGNMTHLPLFRVRSLNNGMRRMAFLYSHVYFFH